MDRLAEILELGELECDAGFFKDAIYQFLGGHCYPSMRRAADSRLF